jgi:hypothetical protein
MTNEAHNDAQKALYDSLAGAEGCRPAARSARLNALGEPVSPRRRATRGTELGVAPCRW